MPFLVDFRADCPACPFGTCLEDRLHKPVRGRDTKFRIRQSVSLCCTFQDFTPGSDLDPDPTRTFDEYLGRMEANVQGAGSVLHPGRIDIRDNAVSKVGGDAFQVLGAAALWNAAAAWNLYMNSGAWPSRVLETPKDAVAAPARKVAIVSLARGYDATRLFKPEVRTRIQAHNRALELEGMELGLSSPDIVGIRLPDPIQDAHRVFLEPINRIDNLSLARIEEAHREIEGCLDGRSFLFAMAFKRSIRSDRLYQPLFEANVLKYLIEEVLKGAAFRFYAALGNIEGADVEKHYKAATLTSLMRGGRFSRAIDAVHIAKHPKALADFVLRELPRFAH